MSTKLDAVQVIQASAGSGKTTALTNRYIELLLAGESPNRILATTFTRKAAGEISSKIFQRLTRAALSQQELKNLSEIFEQARLQRS